MTRILEDVTKYEETFNENLFKSIPKDYFYKFSELIEYITLYNKCVSKIRLAELNSGLEEMQKANEDENTLFLLKERYFLKKRIEQDLIVTKTNVEKNILTNAIVSKKDIEQLKEINKKIEGIRKDIEKIVLNISTKKINVRKSHNIYNDKQNTIAQIQVELNNSVKGIQKCIANLDFDTVMSLRCDENAVEDYRRKVSDLSSVRNLNESTLNFIAKKFEAINDFYINLLKKSYIYGNETIEKYKKREINDNNIMEYIDVIPTLSALQYEDRLDFPHSMNNYANSLSAQLYSIRVINDGMTETYNEFNIGNFNEEKVKLNFDNTKNIEPVIELQRYAHQSLNKSKKNTFSF